MFRMHMFKRKWCGETYLLPDLGLKNIGFLLFFQFRETNSSIITKLMFIFIFTILITDAIQ